MRLNLQLFAKSIEELAKEVIQGKYGNGQARKNALGSNYEAVQSMVNSMLGGSSSTTKPTTPATPVPTTPAVPTTPKGSEIADKTRQELLSSKPGNFTYEIPQSNWQNQIQETLDKILNKEPFSYDLNGDALYQQYKDQYMTQGKLASMDVMGQAAAMNGGYGSSYGQTVGHQAYQDYLQQLNDRVPELYQLALDQYNREGQELYNQYGLLADMDDRDYTRYMDDVKMKYDIHRDSVTDWHNDLNRADSEYWNMVEQEYRTERNAIADAETKKKYAYDTAMGMLNLGVTPSAEMLADAGISSADAKAIVKKVLANEATASSSGSGSGSGNNTWADDVKGSGGGSYINESAVNEFSKKVDDYTKNWDAVMRHMWGSPQQYIAQQIEESKLTDAEKAYLISKYGITEMHLNYKNK